MSDLQEFEKQLKSLEPAGLSELFRERLLNNMQKEVSSQRRHRMVAVAALAAGILVAVGILIWQSSQDVNHGTVVEKAPVVARESAPAIRANEVEFDTEDFPEPVFDPGAGRSREDSVIRPVNFRP